MKNEETAREIAQLLIMIAATSEPDEALDDLSKAAEAILDRAYPDPDPRLEQAREALEAHKAWSIAEDSQLRVVNFQARMDLCSWAQYLTDKVLGMTTVQFIGGPPRMIVWPYIGIERHDETYMRELVKQCLALAPKEKP